jgi:hypothetical protein
LPATAARAQRAKGRWIDMVVKASTRITEDAFMKWTLRCLLPAWGLGLLAAAAAAEPLPLTPVSVAGHASAYDAALSGGCCADSCQPACDTCCATCCGNTGLIVLGEATFFRYHRADGVRVGTGAPGEDVEFDFEVAPRITVGYAGSDGFGARLRWWDYDHTAGTNDGNNSFMTVDTFTLDVELFDTICCGPCWALEVSGGIRYNEFDERMVDVPSNDERLNSFEGWGGIVGLELRRSIGCNSALFARTRGAILMDDKTVFNRDGSVIGNNTVLRDSTQGMVEIALGFEYCTQLDYGMTLFARAAGEWQNWYNFSSSFNPDEDEFCAPSDVGFGGFVFSVGVAR